MTHAIVLLLDDDEDVDMLTGMLTDLRSDGSRVVVCVPPVRGAAFFMDPDAQRQLDAWWEAEIPLAGQPIFVIEHCDGLPGWLVGLDGFCYVGTTDSAAESAYSTCPGVRVVRARSPLDYAVAVMTDLVGVGAYGAAEATRMRSLAAGLPDVPVALPRASAEGTPAVPESGPDPFDLLIAMTLGHADAAAADLRPAVAMLPPTRQATTIGFRLPSWTRRRGSRNPSSNAVDRDLANLLIGRGSTIVAIGSRKGGVGKTSHAAGVAIVGGAALDEVGRCAAIVDANIANPDAWGQLNLPPGAATVRDMIVALAGNHELPRPVHAATSALACFPESREASEYSRTEIGMLAAHLRSKYPLVIVDMSNRLPDPTAGPEAAAAAYWLEHADVLVLPTATAKQDFNGVLDYLEVGDLPPAIVASLVPRTRRNRDHPLAKRYMTAIAHRVYRVVDMPDDAERVRYAGMEGVPVETVSAGLKAAYRELADAIARAPQRVAR